MEKKTHTINELKDQITESLKKEIYLMREVLANMQQEEVAITLLDKNSLNKTLQDRFPLIQKLSNLRIDRVETCKNIQNLACKTTDGKFLPIEKIFPIFNEDGLEVDFLSEQVKSLIEKINYQNSKNDLLMRKYETLSSNHHFLSNFSQNFQPNNQKSKSSFTVAVLSPKKT
ncbi:MAG: flagellar protein FlgN [Chlamydiae bacterium]|nr:flagellar protein FlgN [Chlamydiota bacterium]